MIGTCCDGRFKLKLLPSLALTTVVWLLAETTEASISIFNDVVPSLPIGDPWNVGGPLTVGETLTGEMTIDSGSDVENTDGYVANNAGSTGVVTVNGSGTTWSNSGELRMGNSGAGTLNINGGATVSVGGNTRLGNLPGGSGTANIDGLGSALESDNFFLVGREGNGTLNVFNGGHVSDLIGGIAIFEGSFGAVTIDGIGTLWTNSDEMQVADGGTGFLSILNGGVVASPRGFLAVAAAGIGSAVVSGPDSQWNNSDQLQVGYGGSGTLDVTAGASVTSNFGYLGSLFGSSGAMTVAGVGSSFNNASELSVGYEGSGTLKILGGAQVSDSIATIGNLATGTGTAMVDGTGSTWTNSERLTVGGFGTGTLEIVQGGLVSAGAIDGSGAVSFDGGTLRITTSDSASNPMTIELGGGVVDIPLVANVVTFSGTVMGAGGLTKTGAGILGLAGTSGYSGSTRVAQGVLEFSEANLDDAADVHLAADAALELQFSGTDQIDALFVNSSAQPVGTYGAIGSGADFEILQFAGPGLLRVTSLGLDGDYNDNGTVDAADYTVWRDMLGSNSSLPNDITPGVGNDDYDRWLSRFGMANSSGSSAIQNVPIPEPNFGVQFTSLAAIVGSFRRKSHLKG